MVISGEGSDEIFGGYLYFHKAPNEEEFHRETCRKVCKFSVSSLEAIWFFWIVVASLFMLLIHRLKPCTYMIA